MNILIANWTWYPSGGDWTYVNNICRLYESNGHNIFPFSMNDERNYPTVFSKYFIDKIDYKEMNKHKSVLNSLKVITKSIYSFEAKNKLRELTDANKIDIAQLNNINNYLTPSIISVLKNKGIPIVWRVLDYKLICPNTTFVSGDRVCESCKINKYYMCTVKRCKKDSLRASIIASVESYVYSIAKVYENVDLFLFQSEFSRNKFIEYGFDAKKTVVIENPVDTANIEPRFTNNDFILFFGRIEILKGIFTLLKAMKIVPGINLKIVGSGNKERECLDFIENNSLKNVQYLGPKWGNELNVILEQASFVIVPSEWYEPSPYSVLQSFAMGKAVIGSRIGGIPDLIKSGFNGMLFEPGNHEELAGKIQNLSNDKKKIIEMGRAARNTIDENHDRQKYYEKTIGIFEDLIEKNKT